MVAAGLVLLAPPLGAVIALLVVRDGAGRLLLWWRAAGVLCLAAGLLLPWAPTGERCWGGAQPSALAGIAVDWWVLLGGCSARALFEATVDANRLPMLGHVGYFLLLVAVQTAALALVVAHRARRGGLRDPWRIAVVALVAANSALVLGWRWMEQ